MTEDLDKDGYKIDEKSQKILAALYDRSEMKTRELRELLEEESNSVILYRMREYLKPAGLVEVDREEQVNSGVEPSKVWKLVYPQGQRWVENHRDTLAAPSSLAEVAEMADNATETAQTALDQVQQMQGERGYVEQVRQKLKEHLIQIESLDRAVDSVEKSRERARKERVKTEEMRSEAVDAAREAQEAAESVNVDLAGLRGDVEKLEKELADRWESVSEMDRQYKNSFASVEGDLDELRGRVEEVEVRQESVDNRLEDIEYRLRELEKPWWRRIF